MRYFRRRSTRRFTTFALLVALLFAHSALAVAACIEHLHGSHHDDVAGPDSEGHGARSHHEHGQSLLCQIGCEAQAQSRDYVKASEVPAPLAHKIYFAVPALRVLAWPTVRAEHPAEYVAAAPPALPLTILLSRFRN